MLIVAAKHTGSEKEKEKKEKKKKKKEKKEKKNAGSKSQLHFGSPVLMPPFVDKLSSHRIFCGFL